MKTILFQGDSITDAGRDREGIVRENILGQGYVRLLAARILCDFPGTKIINTGHNGDRISDLYGRWIEDTLNIRFDWLSLLCGINDIGFQLRLHRGADAEKFEFVYDRMLLEVKKRRPKAQIVLCEPFLFKMDRGEVGEGDLDIIDDWEVWNGHMTERQEIVQKLSRKYQTLLVQSGVMFEKACREMPPGYWSVDGIHLTLAGNEMLAREWYKTVGPHLTGIGGGARGGSNESLQQ